MNLEIARDLLSQIQNSSQDEFKEDLIESALRYAQLRVEWLLAKGEERARVDEVRVAAHNSFISHCDILARVMRKHGEDDAWRDALGQDRKRIGDFACWTHCILGLSAR